MTTSRAFVRPDLTAHRDASRPNEKGRRDRQKIGPALGGGCGAKVRPPRGNGDREAVVSIEL
jgi:hypothetical protein